MRKRGKPQGEAQHGGKPDSTDVKVKATGDRGETSVAVTAAAIKATGKEKENGGREPVDSPAGSSATKTDAW